MPTYDYVCDECGHAEERFYPNPNDAPSEMICTEDVAPLSRYEVICSGTMRRQIGAGAGAIFRGPGFHVNDYPKREVKRDE